MQPITPDKLIANAYRTLGLSASAGQAEIDGAARKMRIWPDSSRIPPTQWDLINWLGSVRRSRTDIEQAVAALTEPRTRVQERLLWYQTPTAPAAQSPADEPPIFTLGDATTPAESHDAALAGLHLAHGSDPNIADPGRWKQVMANWTALAGAPAYGDWLTRMERDGDFEKRASPEEIFAALNSVVPAMAGALVAPALAALSDGVGNPAALADLVRLADTGDGDSLPINKLLDSLEDSLKLHCREVEQDLRDRLRTNRQTPWDWHGQNYPIAYHAAEVYNQTIAPALTIFCEVATKNEDRRLRARTRCAALLALLGLGWELSGEFAISEDTLHMALDLARGTPSEPGVLKDLDRIRPPAQAQRAGRDFYGAQKKQARDARVKAAKNNKKGRSGVGITIAVAIGITRLISTMSSSNNYSNRPNTIPDLTIPNLPTQTDPWQYNTPQLPPSFPNNELTTPGLQVDPATEEPSHNPPPRPVTPPTFGGNNRGR